MGRSQAVQAAAAGMEPEAAMNPILIKPSGERHSQVIVMGKPYADANARSYAELKHELRPIVAGALRDLRRASTWSCARARAVRGDQPARPRPGQHVARARGGLPMVIVADIDRGGMFASLFGTLALLERGGPGAGGGICDEQVPRRSDDPRPGPRAAAGADGPPDAGRPVGSCSCARPGWRIELNTAAELVHQQSPPRAPGPPAPGRASVPTARCEHAAAVDVRHQHHRQLRRRARPMFTRSHVAQVDLRRAARALGAPRVEARRQVPRARHE